jgi:hypothetical protein
MRVELAVVVVVGVEKRRSRSEQPGKSSAWTSFTTTSE